VSVRLADQPGLPARGALRAVLFDLDGTLLDTAADITSALNRALAEQGRGAFTAAQVRELIGRGVPSLIERALARLPGPAGEADQALLLRRFHEHYRQLHDCGEFQARAYPGVAQGLSTLFARGLRIGVVTNKAKDAAVDLLARLALNQWIHVVVGGDSCVQRKPHPQPLLLALEALQVQPSQALMVGDSQVDVLAARAAGVAVVCVPYGYNEGADPRSLACDAFVETLGELPALLAS
jgi:phosphoglycolate phosphatase